MMEQIIFIFNGTSESLVRLILQYSSCEYCGLIQCDYNCNYHKITNKIGNYNHESCPVIIAIIFPRNIKFTSRLTLPSNFRSTDNKKKSICPLCPEVKKCLLNKVHTSRIIWKCNDCEAIFDFTDWSGSLKYVINNGLPFLKSMTVD